MSQIDLREFRNACGCFATGVTVVTTEVEGHVHGMTVNAFMSVSLEPPLILVSINNRSRMNRLLPQSGRYAVSILSVEQEQVSQHFAGHPDGAETVFERLAGMPVVAGAVAYFVARVYATHPAGDHTLYVGEVEYFEYHSQEPVLFYGGGYCRLEREEPDGPLSET